MNTLDDVVLAGACVACVVTVISYLRSLASIGRRSQTRHHRSTD